MELQKLHITQKSLKRSQQIPSLMKAIVDGALLPKIKLHELPDGSVEIIDGHHRAMAYFLSGRFDLQNWEYDLILVDESQKRRFGKITDLVSN